MIEKWISLKLKGHKVTVKGKGFLHCDLIEQLFNRLIGKGFNVEIDDLFNAVIEKG